MSLFTFSKEEKLCSQKLIGELFISGDSFLCFPLKIIWKIHQSADFSHPLQVAFSVPKRNFKKAHERNYLRRRMRESYRFHKNALKDFLETKSTKLALMIIYIGKENSGYKVIDDAMDQALIRLKNKI